MLSAFFIVASVASGGPVSTGPAQRIVSVSPTLTEVICALGAGERLVGVTRFDDYPPAVVHLPKIGGFIDPSIEAIVSLHPDLVVVTTNSGTAALTQGLTKLGISWLAVTDHTLADYGPLVTALAERLGAVAKGHQLVEQFDRDCAHLAGGAGTMLVVFGHRPLVVGNAQTFVAELLARAGFTNVYRGSTAYGTLEFETLIALHPQIIFDLEMDGAGQSDRDYYQPVAAQLKQTHIVYSPDPALLRLGPRLPAAVAQLLTVY